MKISKGLPVLALAAAALILGPSPEARAAVTITADGPAGPIGCTLANAILTANTNTSVGGCVRVGATSIDRIIELTYDVTISTKDPSAGDAEDEEYGPNALPAITCHLTINAHGRTIQRDPALFSDPADPCSGPGEKFRVFLIDYPGGSLTLNDAAVKNGCAGDAYGGGGLFYLGHELTLNRVLVANNRAGMGGGVFEHESTLNVNDSTITGNAALAGGGIYNRTGTMRVNNSLLVSNSAIGGSGNVCVDSEGQVSCLPKGSGGALASNGGSLSVIGSTIARNSATSGGVLYNNKATAYITGATLFQNSATNGGVLSNTWGTAIITNATAYQNLATNSGGVVYISGGLAKIVHGTVKDNSAATGGAVFILTKSRSVTLADTILQSAAGGNCVFGAPGAGVTSGGHNLSLSTDTSCGLTGAGDLQVADLGLGNYTDDGTPADGRLPLLPGSPAIDTGIADGTLTDQVGQVRIGLPDRGAIEYPRFLKIWISEKSSADYGLHADLLAELIVDGVPSTPSQLANVVTGKTGFANAILYTIPVPAVSVPSGSTLEVRISARRPCTSSGPASGTVRLWYDGQPVDSGTGADAGSRVGVTAAGATTIFFLREISGVLALDTTAGPGGASRLFSDAAINSTIPCTGSGRPFTSLGTWSVTLPP